MHVLLSQIKKVSFIKEDGLHESEDSNRIDFLMAMFPESDSLAGKDIPTKLVIENSLFSCMKLTFI